MRYFFLAYALIAILVVGIFGFRGEKFSEPPIRIFPDMDEQDKIKAQKPSDFFSDGLGSRQPVAGTQPQGLGSAVGLEFGGQKDYLHSGVIDDYYGNGMPKELNLTEDSVQGFLARGKERYNISCMPCHGASGDGQGIAAQFGVPGVANLITLKEGYPDGRLFDVITKGKGLMSGYGYNIAVRDRWAIIAYIHSLRLARNAPLSDPSIKAAYEAATAGSSN